MTDEQFARMMGVLTEIRDALVSPAVIDAIAPECAHPEDKRVNLSTFTEVHWKCRACKFEHRAPRGALV